VPVSVRPPRDVMWTHLMPTDPSNVLACGTCLSWDLARAILGVASRSYPLLRLCNNRQYLSTPAIDALTRLVSPGLACRI
jgi:hypothetical protein